MMNIITMTAYRRPDYTRQVLESLSKCDGISNGNWVFVPQLEPGCDETIACFDNWNACDMSLELNGYRLGLNKNTNEVLRRARRLYKHDMDLVLHIEDDTVLSPDALNYFEWAVKDLLTPDFQSKDGKQILLASGYNKPNKKPKDSETNICSTRKIWTPWGWAVDKVRLEWFLINWCFQNPKCFTCKFKSTYSKTRREIYPSLSRIQNIGYEAGENDRTPEWYEANHKTRWVAENVIDKDWELDYV